MKRESTEEEADEIKFQNPLTEVVRDFVKRKQIYNNQNKRERIQEDILEISDIDDLESKQKPRLKDFLKTFED